MTAQAFAEVVGTPYDSFLAPVGTVFPNVDDLKATFDPGWIEMGTNGINNQGAEGVTISLGRTVSDFTPAGGTLKVKSWVTDEDITVAGGLVDMSIEQFSLIMDRAAVTTVAATSGHGANKSIKLVRGVAVTYYALLIRGLSPYDDGSGLTCQYEFSRVYQSATQAPKYLKGTPAELAWQFTICGDVSGHDPAVYRAENLPHI